MGSGETDAILSVPRVLHMCCMRENLTRSEVVGDAPREFIEPQVARYVCVCADAPRWWHVGARMREREHVR